MLKKLLIFLIILHVKLTTLHGNLQTESPSIPMEVVKVRFQRMINVESTNAQLLTHIQEIQPSKQSPDTTTEDISDEDEPRRDNSSYVDGSDKVSTFLKELQTGVPESKDDVVPFKATSEYLNKESLIEEGSKNDTYSERFVYMAVGKSEMIPCIDHLELKSTVKSITHVWTNNLGKEIKKGRQARLAVDERYRLSITDAQTDDVGIYHCLLNIVYSEGGEDTNIDNAVRLNVYVDPDLALEFPFVFDSPTCDKERDKKKLNAIKDVICTTSPCVYEFEMTCSTEPWRHTNMPYIPRSKLLILVTKYVDPDYKPPDCKHDCILGNKFGHLLSNLQIVKKAIDMTANDSNLTFFSGLTMLNRKLVYSCEAGFSLYRESCVPCFPGSYNPKKRINACVPCPINTYMEQPGARDCLQCETDKRTEAVGADNIKKCVDKEIRIIQYRMAFYILCGVVGGILGIILAIFIVKMGDRIKKFFIPPHATPSESSKLVAAKQREPPKVTIPESNLATSMAPSSKKLSTAIAEPDALQSVLQGAREKLKKRPEERDKTTSQGVDDTRRSVKDLANRLKEKQLENTVTETLKRKNEGIPNVAVTSQQPSVTPAEHPANQPEGKGKPENTLGLLGKQKRKRSNISDMILQSVQSMTSIAAEFTLPVSSKKSKAKKSKQPTSSEPAGQLQLHDLVRTSQHRITQNKAKPSHPAKTPSNALTTSYPPTNTPINPSQIGIALPELPSANVHTQAVQTVPKTQSNTNVSAATGQLQEKALSKNLNQNSVFIKDYSSHVLWKREDLDMNYAERSYSIIEDEASRDQHFAQLSPPHYLYDEIYWMPNPTTASEHTNIPDGNASVEAGHGPSSANSSPKSVLGYGHMSGSQWNQNGGEQNTSIISSYAMQAPHQSQNTMLYSIQQPNYYPDSWPGYLNTRQQGYEGYNRARPEQ